MKDQLGISRAAPPWKTPDSYEKRPKWERANFEKEFADAAEEYPLCSGCKLKDCIPTNRKCALRIDRGGRLW